MYAETGRCSGGCPVICYSSLEVWFVDLYVDLLLSFACILQSGVELVWHVASEQDFIHKRVVSTFRRVIELDRVLSCVLCKR